ncbi:MULTISPECIES: 50S ribosomal protein L5 [unclassified Marinitoga]|uniref:50S ribosomal protein L5 n=1 Tax=unclassified Marinitoga TaxID=2640159 RepID=UPI000640D2AB|nr:MULTISPECIES: 50S ribosomal protein L5 [unclassified Marinitoga]KLO23853.1 50S ribosomal protein L5 [Marinitoga sp. 1155]NUU99067.1 50S ribosomal protein L5 [Marinitoga sp. 1154]
MRYEYIPLKEQYEKEVVPALMKEFGYKNIHEVPKIVKIVVNMGIGEGARNADVVEKHAQELSLITGQKAVVTRAKKSVANFKLREGMPIGAKVTLRNVKMYNFLFKLINIIFPKLRDFRGMNPNSFDGRGNYTFGLTEQLVFPELKPDQVKRVQGMDITIVTTAKTDEEARKLLQLMGFPFKRD